MQLQSSLVTVILPVYNAGKYLHECLASLEQQTHKDIQIIAIDDHSRDDSFEILKQFKHRFTNMHVFRNKKRYGAAICYNRAMKLAEGKFVAFMNAHDVNSISRFKRQVNFLLNNPKTVAVGTQYTRIDDQNKKIDRSELPQEHDTIYDNMIHTSSLHPETVMINRELLPKDLLYFKHNKYPYVFTEVFVKFFQYGRVANIKQSLYFHRESAKRQGRKLSRYKEIKTMVKLWFSSRSNHDYRPSIRTTLPAMFRNA